jgi:membrane protein implicated in regulation of membrane protease activity
MIEAWNNLEPLAKFFWCVAIGGTMFQILLFLSSFLGGDFDGHGDSSFGGHGGHGGGGGDHAGQSPHDAAHGVKILSVRAAVAFAMGFGWAGVLGLYSGWSLVAASIAALACGVVFMFVIYLLMRLMVSMQDPGGGLDYWKAVGLEGHVYFTIPGAHAGEGQIEIMLQGRLITANAVTEHPDPIPPRAPVIVISVEGQTLLVVEPATVRDHLSSH